MKKNKRSFLKNTLSLVVLSFFFKPIIEQKNFIKNKFKMYKRKYSKVWILDIDDN